MINNRIILIALSLCSMEVPIMDSNILTMLILYSQKISLGKTMSLQQVCWNNIFKLIWNMWSNQNRLMAFLTTNRMQMISLIEWKTIVMRFTLLTMESLIRWTRNSSSVIRWCSKNHLAINQSVSETSSKGEMILVNTSTNTRMGRNRLLFNLRPTAHWA